MRDRRGDNAFGPEGRETHERLMAWAMWQASEGGRGSSMSTIARLMEYGANGAGAGDAPVTMPDHLQAVDSAVTQLPEREKHIVIGYYCDQKPWEALAHELYTSVDAIKNSMRSARNKIGGFVRGWLMARSDE